jgi:branched-chain amino acid transport system permease protein
MTIKVRSFLTGSPWLALLLFIGVAFLPELGVGGYWQRQIMLIAIYTLLCSGLNLSFGYAGELALGQVAVFATGAYVSAILYNRGHTDILWGLLAAVIVAAIVGLLSGIPGLRLSHWSLALVSFFLVLLIPSATTIFDKDTGGALGLPGILGPTIFGHTLGNRDFYLTCVIVTMVWMFIFRNLIVSRFGSSLRVLGESPTLVESLGGSVFRLRIQAYVIGALPAGLAGCLFTYLTGFVSPDSFTMELLIAVLAATVVGGADSVWGAPIGAALLVLGPLQASSFEKYSIAVYGVFLILVGTLFSGGLVGLVRQAQRYLARRLDRGKTLTEKDALAEVDQSVLSIPGERLVVQGVEKQFAGLKALSGVDLVVEPGTITAIIGANGAGKTTLLNLVSGLLRADAGEVHLADRRLTGMRAHKVARLGVGRTFQTPMIPGSMSVLQVVESGRLRHGRVGFLSAILRLPKLYRVRKSDREAAMAALSFAGLAHMANQEAGSLPLGTRRLLEVVRSVAGEPNVLLLDEPAAGLDDVGLGELGALMRRARDAGGTVVIVEHNVPFVMSIADQVFVMELGKVIASGPPNKVRNDPRVIDSYLGRRGQRDAAAPPDVEHLESEHAAANVSKG